MKKVSFVEFEQLFSPIIKFINDSDVINDALKTLYPSSFVLQEHGNELLDYYIDLTERYLELENDWVSWFVFENNLGKNKLKVDESDINSLEDFYSMLTIS